MQSANHVHHHLSLRQYVEADDAPSVARCAHAKTSATRTWERISLNETCSGNLCRWASAHAPREELAEAEAQRLQALEAARQRRMRARRLRVSRNPCAGLSFVGQCAARRNVLALYRSVSKKRRGISACGSSRLLLTSVF